MCWDSLGYQKVGWIVVWASPLKEIVFIFELMLLVSWHKYMIHIFAYIYVNVWGAQKDMGA